MGRYSCHSCGYDFQTSARLSRHLSRPCTAPRRRFLRTFVMGRHVNSCSHCGEDLPTICDFQAHVCGAASAPAAPASAAAAAPTEAPVAAAAAPTVAAAEAPTVAAAAAPAAPTVAAAVAPTVAPPTAAAPTATSAAAGSPADVGSPQLQGRSLFAAVRIGEPMPVSGAGTLVARLADGRLAILGARQAVELLLSGAAHSLHRVMGI